MPTPSPPTTTPTREPVPAGDGGAPIGGRSARNAQRLPAHPDRGRQGGPSRPGGQGDQRASWGVSNMPLPEPYLLAIAGRGLAASGAPADPGLAGSSSLSRAVISRICAGRPSRSGRWRHAGLADRSGRGTTQQASMNAKPEPHGAPTVLRGGGPAGQALGQTTPPTPGGLC
jgi:hypothetical protein